MRPRTGAHSPLLEYKGGAGWIAGGSEEKQEARAGAAAFPECGGRRVRSPSFLMSIVVPVV